MSQAGPVASRYAAAFFDSAKERGALDQAAEEFEKLEQLVVEHEPLRRLLFNPDVEIDEKVGILDRLLQGAWSQDTQAFVRVLLSFGRVEHLAEMAEAFRGLVDRQRGILQVCVRTARGALPEPLKATLTARLEQMEQRRIRLVEERVPELIGGIQVIMDNRILDGAVSTELSDLRRLLKSVRVH
jgi:F-type H+-transporting ATPase subunit delta